MQREQRDFSSNDNDDIHSNNAKKSKNDKDEMTTTAMAMTIMMRTMATKTRTTTMRLMVDGNLVFDHECNNNNLMRCRHWKFFMQRHSASRTMITRV